MKDQTNDPRLLAFKRLLDIMDDLREKCPWDRKQTLESLRYLTIEETYELSDAIIEKDMEEVRKELGDLMLHLVFYAKIGSETNDFNITDVLNGICEKLIVRHPHIYGDVEVQDEEDVKRNWELIKLKEKGNKKKTILGGVPKSLPAMIKAMRIQEKAKGAGFDWDNKEQVWDKVEEEMAEFQHEYKDVNNIDQDKATGEFGDLLFSLINYSRFVNIDPETALELTNKKFIRRFNYLEERVQQDGKEFGQMTLEEMDAYWNEAKTKGI
ncbi:nucleoside triphosphate pyrophosphohydrolase [Limibacter armeniacum]|uniref:nucleoside triphosphate pyrophosphohydrolase n=1 Tax=Limibacter armeniacum TaxID=466084 RepID=UPI002FE5D3F0